MFKDGILWDLWAESMMQSREEFHRRLDHRSAINSVHRLIAETHLDEKIQYDPEAIDDDDESYRWLEELAELGEEQSRLVPKSIKKVDWKKEGF